MEQHLTRRNFVGVAAASASGAVPKRVNASRLRTAIREGCAWITDVAQMKSDTLRGESNSNDLRHRHWKGAMRGEYRAATRQWDFFCPTWHTGQAIKALVLAAKALNQPGLLDAARFSAGFIEAERIADKAHPHYGLIFGFEDRGDQVNTSALLECVDGLWLLSDATGDNRYGEWALAATSWVARNAYIGGGLVRDAFNVTTWRFVAPPWETDKPGRPLNDDAVFLKAWQRGHNPEHRKIFFEIAERLLREENPSGNWIGFKPCDAVTGSIHPRHAYWWGWPMVAAWRESRDRRYLECASRAGEWYLNAMRTDGGLFRSTRTDFKTPSFGHENSGIACATMLWQDLWKETREERWLTGISTALRGCLNLQFRDVGDPNLKGAILEKVLPPDGTDRLPYHLRDLGTIFFVQAASRFILENIPS
ncbi:MAG: hypothetical protein LLG20_15740 [Acidobacteriales bacterium]|nr:hypothetical protein [Terriglobales bacterium]